MPRDGVSLAMRVGGDVTPIASAVPELRAGAEHHVEVEVVLDGCDDRGLWFAVAQA